MAKREKARAQSQRIIKLQIEQDEQRKQQEAYRQQRAAYYNSLKGQRESKIRTMLQNVSKIDGDVSVELLKATQQFADDLFELICESLNLNENTSAAEIENTLNECLPALKKLKTLSDVKEIQSKDLVHRYSIYERLFNKLMDMNINFAMFAPKGSVERPAVERKIASNPMVKKEVENNLALMSADEKFDYVSSHQVCSFEPDNKTVSKSQKLITEIEQHQRLAGTKMAYATQELSDNVYTFIENELYVDTLTPSIKDIEDVFSVSLFVLKRLKDLTKNPHINKVKTWKINPYDNLFRRLIQLDVRLALFAPSTSLNFLDYDFKKLSEPEKEVLFKHIQKAGLWENEEFVKTYHHVFAVQMSKMNELVKM
jgi:hypothetical protein